MRRNTSIIISIILAFCFCFGTTSVYATPLSELQALGFVLTELGLYLDTHPNDAEAFQLFQKYAALEKEGRIRYEEQCGPLQQTSAAMDDRYTWTGNPWPWNFSEEVK